LIVHDAAGDGRVDRSRLDADVQGAVERGRSRRSRSAFAYRPSRGKGRYCSASAKRHAPK
jgi:hypothetical protein